MTKTKLTVTLDDDHTKYITDIANCGFEGNESMALRKIIAEHSRVPKEMWNKILS